MRVVSEPTAGADGVDLDERLAQACARALASEVLVAEEQRRGRPRRSRRCPTRRAKWSALYYREGQSARRSLILWGWCEDAVKQRLAARWLRAALLDEVGETLRVTAPGKGFTAGVMALTVAAPSTAAAAGIGVGVGRLRHRPADQDRR